MMRGIIQAVRRNPEALLLVLAVFFMGMLNGLLAAWVFGR
jgi:hypothetical protein